MPRRHLETVTADVVDEVAELARVCTGGIKERPDANRRLWISPAFAGCGVRIDGVGPSADAAFVATWYGMNERVKELLAKHGIEVENMAGHAHAIEAHERLLGEGVAVETGRGKGGAVRLTQSASQTYLSTPLANDFPLVDNSIAAAPTQLVATVAEWTPGRVPMRMISRICKHLDAHEAAKMWTYPHATDQDEVDYRRQVYLSAGGANAGALWTSYPDGRDGFMQSSHFQVATRRRLAILEAPPDAKCGITDTAKAGYTAPCGQPLDKRMRHTTAGCRKGVAKNRPHDALKRMLARLLAAAGAFVDEERIVPELCLGDPTKDDYMEATMDIVATFPTATSQCWIDVTIRSPHAVNYNQSPIINAANTPGVAAEAGVQDKLQRYKSTSVYPVSFEVYGRIATGSLRRLQELAINASAIALDRWAATDVVLRWIQACQKTILYMVADRDLAALGHEASRIEGAITRGQMTSEAINGLRGATEVHDTSSALNNSGNFPADSQPAIAVV